MSLNDVLAAHGYTTRPAPGNYRKHILDADGEVVFTGTAHDVWEWIGRPTPPSSSSSSPR